MKSDRIFLNNDPNSYSEKEFSGIKLEDIVSKLASVHEAKESETLPKELLAAIRGEDVEGTPTRNLKVAEMPEAFKEWVIKDGKPCKNDDADKGDDDGDGDDDKEDKKDKKEVKASRTRKLHFDDPSQISAEALRTAEASGDAALINAIRSVREAVRKDLSDKLDDQAQVLAEKSAKLAKRKQYRMTVVSNTKTAKSVLAAAKPNTKTASEIGFKSPSEFNAAEKSAFVRKAMQAGFDQDYIEAFLGESVTAESNTLKEIKGVMAAELPATVKASALRGLIREAHLDSENIARLRHYWIDELGYGDEQWVDDLFTNKYDS